VAPCCIKAAAAGEGKQRVARRNAAGEPSSGAREKGANNGALSIGKGGEKVGKIGKTWRISAQNSENSNV
jgi:hypothetical protein